MKLNKLIITTIAVLTLSLSVTAQVNGRLPRKAIIGAMQNAMQDSTGSSLKPFVCKPNTVSITIEVTNNSLPEERPYTITADSLGVTLEIFRGHEHVYNEYFHYRGSNFARIKAKANSAKLKKSRYMETLLMEAIQPYLTSTIVKEHTFVYQTIPEKWIMRVTLTALSPK